MAIETNELIDVKTLSPFKKFIMTIGNLPTSYLESMTYGEMLMWFCNYLQETVIPTVNNNAEAVEELQALYIELKNYVDNYFENLDVQTEISNKLDEMASNGELTELIKNYVDPYINSQNVNIQNFEEQVTLQLNDMSSRISSVESGSPLVASSTSEMTDTDRVYVNTTDGKWYYYDGDSWEIGGTYQATGIDPDDPVIENITDQLEEIRTKVESKQLFDYTQIIDNKTLQNTALVSTPNDLTDATGISVSNIIYFDEPLTENTDFSTNILGFSRCLSYTYYGGNDVRSGNYSNSNFVADSEHGNRKITISASVSVPITCIRFSYSTASNTNLKSLYFCKTSDYEDHFDTEFKNYYKLNDRIDVSHLIAENPVDYNGNEVNTFYKGIAIGDSLTEGTFNTLDGFIVHKQYAYPMYFYKKTGVTLRNFGIGGATAQSWYERYENVGFPVYDFAIIALGVNDILQGVTTSTTTTYINNIVNKLKSENADVKCFISTINKAYKNSAGWSAMNTALRNYALSTANCYLLDIAEYGKTDLGTNYVNGHLTAIGYQQLANEYANMISWNIKRYQEDFVNIQFSGTTYTNLPTD